MEDPRDHDGLIGTSSDKTHATHFALNLETYTTLFMGAWWFSSTVRNLGRYSTEKWRQREAGEAETRVRPKVSILIRFRNNTT